MASSALGELVLYAFNSLPDRMHVDHAGSHEDGAHGGEPSLERENFVGLHRWHVRGIELLRSRKCWP